ncbi:MAG TPA: Na+/H+ antiporter NhaA, partial [Acidimicrobiales bacterium]|nr:Na+/H+ antiporter NhaA [Acidimicrobiales bacterium]
MSTGPMARARRRVTPVTEFLNTEAGGGVILLAATIVALAWANSPWSQSYADLWHTGVTVGRGSWAISEDLQHWVNDALMAIFFFLVGLEIKREVAAGELRDPRRASLPAFGAVGGMAAPALVYLLVAGEGAAAGGWGIPMATDIAFAVGVLALLGSKAPAGLKVFLLALAIIDDIGAIAVIAVFYSSGTSVAWMAAAAATLAAVLAVRRLGLTRPIAYIPLGAAAWYCTYRAGIHPTIAGVVLGVMTPAWPVGGRPVLEQLEHRLHPLSSYVVVPVFALANAGVALDGEALSRAGSSRVTWGIAAGLVVGKTVGITVAAVAARRLRIGRLPDGVDNLHLLGAGALGGIGFTVALFIASLAFDDAGLQAEAKVGILAGSLVSGLVGVTVLALNQPPPARRGRRAPGPA